MCQENLALESTMSPDEPSHPLQRLFDVLQRGDVGTAHKALATLTEGVAGYRRHSFFLQELLRELVRCHARMMDGDDLHGANAQIEFLLIDAVWKASRAKKCEEIGRAANGALAFITLAALLSLSRSAGAQENQQEPETRLA